MGESLPSFWLARSSITCEGLRTEVTSSACPFFATSALSRGAGVAATGRLIPSDRLPVIMWQWLHCIFTKARRPSIGSPRGSNEAPGGSGAERRGPEDPHRPQQHQGEGQSDSAQHDDTSWSRNPARYGSVSPY